MFVIGRYMHVIIFPENETHRAPCIVEIALFFWFHLYVVFLHFKKKKKKKWGGREKGKGKSYPNA